MFWVIATCRVPVGLISLTLHNLELGLFFQQQSVRLTQSLDGLHGDLFGLKLKINLVLSSNHLLSRQSSFVGMLLQLNTCLLGQFLLGSRFAGINLSLFEEFLFQKRFGGELALGDRVPFGNRGTFLVVRFQNFPHNTIWAGWCWHARAG